VPPFARSPWVLTLFGVALIAAGTVTAYTITIDPAREARAASAWRETTCHVTRSIVTMDRRGKRRSYDAAIEYEYEVGGRRYAGSRVAFTSGYGNRVEAAETVARYPLGWDSPCWYDPANPASATLSRTVAERMWSAFHLLFLFGGLGVLGWRRRIHPGASPRGSRLLELIAIAWIAAVIGVVGSVAFDLGHTTTGTLAYGVAAVTVGWFAHQVRAVLRGRAR